MFYRSVHNTGAVQEAIIHEADLIPTHAARLEAGL